MKPHGLHPDRIAGAVITAVGAFLLYTASPLPFGRLNSPEAGFFPIVLATMLTALGAVLFVSSFRTESFSLELTPRSWLVPLSAALLVAYALLVNRIGFIICTTAVLLTLTKANGLTWRTSLLLCVPAVLAAYIGFSELGVPLPRGIFGWF
ncbi:MAG: tripartite tricarboxylate transporter TctB family protein [Pseudorhodoplanes sp.]|uniref:tripartite tricarboxylate transporter TctB family protein n=1 Tax=Pseudorhodoplanes sp. TaxID=1934341 RepID=UPI003D105D22